MTAPDLLSWRAPSHRSDPETSKRAAESVGAVLGTDRGECLAVIKKAGPCSATDVAGMLGWKDVYRARRRISDLHKAGMIEDSGERGKTALGRSEVLWRAVTP